jgi:hypothetical protein
MSSMSKPTILIALLALAVFGGVAAAPAGAASATANAIIDDCSSSPTGMLQRTYAKSDLRDAQGLLRGDVAEYTGCNDAIRAALRDSPGSSSDGTGGNSGGTGGGGTGGSGTGGGSGSGLATGGGSTGGNGSGATGGGTGSGTATADGSAAPGGSASATHEPGSDKPVQLAGATITPGFGDAGDGGRSLPTPLIVFLALLAAGAVGVAASTIGRRVLARRRA